MFSLKFPTSAPWSKKGKKPIGTNNRILRQSQGSDFFSYSFHYNDNTVCTKNGELLQVIKINKTVISTALHDALSSIVGKYISQSPDIAIWFNLVRTQHDVSINTKFDSEFSAELIKAWSDDNKLDESYINDIYITIVTRGPSTHNRALAILTSLIPFYLSRTEIAYLKKKHKLLNKTTVALAQELGDEFKPKILSIYQQEGVYYSEILSFFHQIISTDFHPERLEACDISYLTEKYKTVFGFNTFEIIRISDDAKRFGAVFTFKGYSPVSSYVKNRLLRIPCRFIITQSITTESQDKKSSSEYQRYILSISKDEKLFKEMLFEKNYSKSVNHITTISIISLSLKQLDLDITRVLNEIYKIGLIIYRNDLRTEQAFLAQFPANFPFRYNSMPIQLSKIGGLIRFADYGKMDSKWYDTQLAIFKTYGIGLPVFFNFHNTDESIGHTIVCSKSIVRRYTLTNFLLAHANRNNTKIISLDSDHASQIFTKAINAQYNTLDKSSNLTLNPFKIPDNPKNRLFLKNFIRLIVKKESLFSDLDQLMDLIFKSEYNTLSEVQKYAVKAGLGDWVRPGQYGHLIDNKNDNLSFHENIAIDLSYLYSLKQELTLPIIYYLLKKIEDSLDGQPTIIVISNIERIDNPIVFGGSLKSWLEKMNRLNVVVILVSDSEKIAEYEFSKDLSVITNVFIYIEYLNESVYKRLPLKSTSTSKIHSVPMDTNYFFMQQATYSNAIEFSKLNLHHISVLYSTKSNIAYVNNIDQKQDWLEVFYKKINENN